MISAMSGLDDFLEKKDDILSANERKSDDFVASICCWLVEDDSADGLVGSVDKDGLGMDDLISSCTFFNTDCIICVTLELLFFALLSCTLLLLVKG